MDNRGSLFQKLMNIDMSLPLMVAALVLCVVGFVYGTGTAIWVLVYAFIGLFAIGMPLLLLYASHSELAQLREIQKQHGGRVRRGWFFLGPSLRFNYAENPAEVRLIRRRGKHRPDDVQVTVDWLGEHPRLEIRPHGVVSKMGRLVGLQDIKLGRATFDDAYVVQGTDPNEIRRLLSRDVQHAILELPEQKYLNIRLANEKLTILAQHYSLESDLRSFLEASLRLYEALQISQQRQ